MKLFEQSCGEAESSRTSFSVGVGAFACFTACGTFLQPMPRNMQAHVTAKAKHSNTLFKMDRLVAAIMTRAAVRREALVSCPSVHLAEWARRSVPTFPRAASGPWPL